MSEKAASCTRIGEENSIEVAHISITFVRIVFSLVCSISSYSIELVTELSCLLFYISDFCLHHSFTTAHFSHDCMLSPTVRVVWWPGLLYLELLSLTFIGALEIIFGLFLCLPSCPELCAACTTCLQDAWVWVRGVPFQPYTTPPANWVLGVFRWYNPILGNALSDRPSHLLRSVLIRCSSFTTVLVGMT